MAPASSKSRARRLFGHRALIAVEALLVASVLKDWILDRVKGSSMPNWGKVLFVMALTVGLLGGLFLALQSLSTKGVGTAHKTLKSASGLPTALVHALILFLLFLLYARMLKLRVFA